MAAITNQFLADLLIMFVEGQVVLKEDLKT